MSSFADSTSSDPQGSGPVPHGPRPVGQGSSGRLQRAPARPDPAASDPTLSDQALSDQALSDQALSDQALSDQAQSDPAPPEPEDGLPLDPAERARWIDEFRALLEGVDDGDLFDPVRRAKEGEDRAETERKALEREVRLQELTELNWQRTELEAAEHHSVRQAREAGISWQEIGRALGISKQAAHKKFDRRTPGVDQQAP